MASGSAGLGREVAWGQCRLTLPWIKELSSSPVEERVRGVLKPLVKRGDIPEDIPRAIYEGSRTPGVCKQMLAALRSGVSFRSVKPSASSSTRSSPPYSLISPPEARLTPPPTSPPSCNYSTPRCRATHIQRLGTLALRQRPSRIKPGTEYTSR